MLGDPAPAVLLILIPAGQSCNLGEGAQETGHDVIETILGAGTPINSWVGRDKGFLLNMCVKFQSSVEVDWVMIKGKTFQALSI